LDNIKEKQQVYLKVILKILFILQEFSDIKIAKHEKEQESQVELHDF